MRQKTYLVDTVFSWHQNLPFECKPYEIRILDRIKLLWLQLEHLSFGFRYGSVCFLIAKVVICLKVHSNNHSSNLSLRKY